MIGEFDQYTPLFARSECERLTAENERLRAELQDSDGHLKALHGEFDRAEAQHDVLTTRLCEEVDKARNAFGQAELMNRADAAESGLAAATALLKRAGNALNVMLDQLATRNQTSIRGSAVAREVYAFLANQPAAPTHPRCPAHDAVLANLAWFKCGCRYVQPAAPTRTDHKPECVGIDQERMCECTPARTEAELVTKLDAAIDSVKAYHATVARTEAEQAVLDAMAKAEITEFAGRPCLKSRSRANSDVASAELTRRGLK